MSNKFRGIRVFRGQGFRGISTSASSKGECKDLPIDRTYWSGELLGEFECVVFEERHCGGKYQIFVNRFTNFDFGIQSFYCCEELII